METRATAMLAVLLAFTTVACGANDDAEAVNEETPATEAATERASFTITGDFQTPESVLHDPTADVYLVSNINGDPLGKDDNGYIVRVSPDGQVTDPRWIDGARDGVTLHAPKGMALRGDTLFVADIDSLRAFERTSGAPLGAWGAAGVTFLNDVAAGPDGTIHVTDSGFTTGFEPSGSDAVYALSNGALTAVVKSPDLGRPNGIVAHDGGLVAVGFGGNTTRLIADGQASVGTSLPTGQLDGVVRLSDGTLLVSSWEGSAVYSIAPDGTVATRVSDVEAPADLGLDEARGRVLIPLFNGNRIEVRPVR